MLAIFIIVWVASIFPMGNAWQTVQDALTVPTNVSTQLVEPTSEVGEMPARRVLTRQVVEECARVEADLARAELEAALLAHGTHIL